MIAMFGIFVAWFIVDSIFFARPDMPALRARQMLSFPFGVLIESNKEKVEKLSDKMRIIPGVGGVTCIVFMAVTQLPTVKALPYLALNGISLLTCFPMAIGIILLGRTFDKLFINRMLIVMGQISYEIYLVHAFTLSMIGPSTISIFMFMLVTFIFSYVLHMMMRKVKYGKLDSGYINQK